MHTITSINLATARALSGGAVEPLQKLKEIRRCPTAGCFRDRFRSALHNDTAATFAGAGADFDNPIAGGNNSHVVLDDDDGISGLNQAVELRDEAFDVGWMQTGCGLVENVKRFAALATL